MARFTRNTLALGTILMVIAIILGAFGAHALEARLTPDQLDTFETGVRYHFYHALSILIIALLSQQRTGLGLSLPVLLIVLGVICFSGSIYLLATRDLHGLPVGFLGPVTPIGGSLLIIAWVIITIRLLRLPAST